MMQIEWKSLGIGMMIIAALVNMVVVGWHLAKKYDLPPQVPNELRIVIEEQLLRERTELIKALVEKINLEGCTTTQVRTLNTLLPEIEINCIRKRKRK